MGMLLRTILLMLVSLGCGLAIIVAQNHILNRHMRIAVQVTLVLVAIIAEIIFYFSGAYAIADALRIPFSRLLY